MMFPKKMTENILYLFPPIFSEQELYICKTLVVFVCVLFENKCEHLFGLFHISAVTNGIQSIVRACYLDSCMLIGAGFQTGLFIR